MCHCDQGTNYYYRGVILINYHEILRLFAQGISQRSIARRVTLNKHRDFEEVLFSSVLSYLQSGFLFSFVILLKTH